MSVLVLGADTGMAHFGWALVELRRDSEEVGAMGVIVTEPSDKKARVLAACDDFRRGREVACALDFVVKQRVGGSAVIGSPVRAVCYEAISLPRNARTSAQIGIAFGALAAFAQQYDIPAHEVSPQGLKKALTGSGSATKEQVALALAKRYGLAYTPPGKRKKGDTFGVTEGRNLLAHLPAGLHEHAWDALGAVVACLRTDTMLAVRPR